MEKVTEQIDIQLKCAPAQFGWFWNTSMNMPINLRQLWPSRQKLGVAGTRCGVKLNNLISIAAAKTVKAEAEAKNDA
jgi:hypothetical protein